MWLLLTFPPTACWRPPSSLASLLVFLCPHLPPCCQSSVLSPTPPPGHTSLLRRNSKAWLASETLSDLSLCCCQPRCLSSSCSLPPFQALWPLWPSNICLGTFAFVLPYVFNCPWACGGMTRSLLHQVFASMSPPQRAPPWPFSQLITLACFGFLHSTEYVTLCSVLIYYLS